MKRTLIALTTVALAAGCTSAASSPSHTTPPPSRASSMPLVVRHPTPHPPTVVITEKDAGHVVHVHRGDVVSWQLYSTYWTMGRPGGGVLVRTANHVPAVPRHRSHSCDYPGSGCGTVQLDFRAAASGRVTLKAHRISCGEALRCVGKQGSFSVTVIVD